MAFHVTMSHQHPPAVSRSLLDSSWCSLTMRTLASPSRLLPYHLFQVSRVTAASACYPASHGLSVYPALGIGLPA
jgi:hypothetical protein